MLQNGQVIQNYEIVKPLGKGKFSIVYMAKHLTDNSMCALKKINIFNANKGGKFSLLLVGYHDFYIN